MSADPFEDPEARAWAQRVVDELIPMISDSALTVSIVPTDAGVDDVKFAVELGLSIMLDKPIVLAVAPGRRIPHRLAMLATAIVEVDGDDPAGTQRRLGDAIRTILDQTPDREIGDRE